MYESDGSVMVYWHALDSTETPTGELIYTHCFSRHADLSVFALSVTILSYMMLCHYSMIEYVHLVVPGNVSVHSIFLAQT